MTSSMIVTACHNKNFLSKSSKVYTFALGGRFHPFNIHSEVNLVFYSTQSGVKE